MTTKAHCALVATAAIKIGASGEFIPACEEHITDMRERAAELGKKPLPSAPKGAKGAELEKHNAAVAAIAGRNGDDVLPIEVRPLSMYERESAVKCYAHLIPAE